MIDNIITSHITSEERETHFSNEYESGVVICDSTIPRDFNKCVRQGWTILKRTLYEDGTIAGMILQAPRKALSIRNATASKRVMTEEQRQAAADRLKIARESK